MVHIVVLQFNIVKTVIRAEIEARGWWLSTSIFVALGKIRLDFIGFSLILISVCLFSFLFNLGLIYAFSDNRIVVGVEWAKIWLLRWLWPTSVICLFFRLLRQCFVLRLLFSLYRSVVRSFYWRGPIGFLHLSIRLWLWSWPWFWPGWCSLGFLWLICCKCNALRRQLLLYSPLLESWIIESFLRQQLGILRSPSLFRCLLSLLLSLIGF